MPIVLKDSEIEELLKEKKALPSDYRKRLETRRKRGHRERELVAQGEKGNKFSLILRRSDFNPLDFSVILGLRIKNTNRIFRLCRYNGKSHEHTNKIEGRTFYDFHIHRATERYQELGAEEEAYAEPVDVYATFEEALRCLLKDCGFVVSDDGEPFLFNPLKAGD